jgi:hypothetical protein
MSLVNREYGDDADRDAVTRAKRSKVGSTVERMEPVGGQVRQEINFSQPLRGSPMSSLMMHRLAMISIIPNRRVNGMLLDR